MATLDPMHSTTTEKTNQEPQPVVVPSKSDQAHPFSGFFGRVVNSLGIVFAMGILGSALILIIEIVMRHVLNKPTIWAHETVIFINGCAFVFGGLFVAARDAHIRVVLLYDHFPSGFKRYMNVIISILCLAASAMFAWASWLMVKKAAWRPGEGFHLETSGSAWDPVFPGMLKIFVFVVMILLSIQFLIFTVNYLFNKEHD